MDSELYMAAIRGDINVFKEKRKNIDIEKQLTPIGSNVLHLAAESGKREFVEEILSTHPQLLRIVNKRRDYPLHHAARGGNPDIVRLIIEANTKFWDNGDGRHTHKAMRRMLSVTDEYQNTALHEAVRFNHGMVVSILLQEYKKLQEAKLPIMHTANAAEETPLYMAAFGGYHNIVKDICTALPADASAGFGGPHHTTALHAAIISNSQECVTSLLDWKKSLTECRDYYGRTALHYAAHLGRVDMIQYLLKDDKKGAYQTDNDKRTALHMAASEGKINLLKEIIKFCPDCCDLVDKSGRNVLHIAVENNSKQMIECVFENCPLIGKLLHQINDDGNTPYQMLRMSAPEFVGHPMSDTGALSNLGQNPMQDVIISVDNQGGVDDQLVSTAKGTIGTANPLLSLWKDATPLNRKSMKLEDSAEEIEKIKKVNETHMVVAALIVTITFAAGFTLPGGYHGDGAPDAGMAVLIRDKAFKAFIITDTLGFLLSTSSLLIYFLAAGSSSQLRVLEFYCSWAAYLLRNAVGAMVIAFTTGTYAVLAPSASLAVPLCVIGSYTLLLIFCVFLAQGVDASRTALMIARANRRGKARGIGAFEFLSLILVGALKRPNPLNLFHPRD